MLDVALACLGHSLERHIRLDGVLDRFKALPRRPAVRRVIAHVARVAFEWRRRRHVLIVRSQLLLFLYFPLRVIG